MSVGSFLSKLLGRGPVRACYSSVGRACYSTVGRQVGVWGACTDGGQPHLGTGEAPGLIRAAGLIPRLEAGGHDVTDHGDLVGRRGGPEEVFSFNKSVADKVAGILGQGQVCVTLGGDHSIGLGTLAGSLQHDPDTVVIWVDAHADINTLAGSESGNMHGMPVSFHLASLNTGSPSWLEPRLQPRHLAYLGLRDVETAEREVIRDLGIAAYYTQDIDRLGVVGAVRETLARVDPEGARKIHLSFDIDVLCPLEAPATGTPVRGGLTLREALTICDLIHSTGRLTAVDMVEVNPRLGATSSEVEQTVGAACTVLLAALGLRRNPPV